MRKWKPTRPRAGRPVTTVHVSLGVGAQVRRATDLLASRAQCPLWVISGHSTPSWGMSAIGPKADLVMRASDSPLSAISRLRCAGLGCRAERLGDVAKCRRLSIAYSNTTKAKKRPLHGSFCDLLADLA